MPNVPTVVEAGYPGAVFRFWNGISAPAKTPPDDREQTARRDRAGAEDPAVQGKAGQARRRAGADQLSRNSRNSSRTILPRRSNSPRKPTSSRSTKPRRHRPKFAHLHIAENLHHDHHSAAHRPPAVGCRANKARPVAALRQYARHALLPRRGVGAVLQGRIRPPLSRVADENARAETRRGDRSRRPEPLELWRRDAVADRPLGMARAVELRAGAARRRAHHDLFHGRHARRSRAPAGRDRGQGRPP